MIAVVYETTCDDCLAKRCKVIKSVQKQLGNIALSQVYKHEGTQIFTVSQNTR